MTEPVSRATVDAFYQAYASGDPDRIGAMIDDDVEWHVNGPVEVIRVCGTWRGRAAVVDRFARLVPRILSSRHLEIEDLLVDGDRSAMFGRFISHHRQSGRVISHRISHIAHYRNGKVVSFRVVNDSFDAVEQFLGHPLDLGDAAEPRRGDLIAI